MPKKKKSVRHPWDKWFNQERFRIVRGKHFEVAPYCMAGQIRNKAPLYGVRVSIKVTEDVLVVTVS